MPARLSINTWSIWCRQLDRCARAHAWLAGRDFITPDDVRAIAHNALRHRLILSYEASAAGVDADRVISELLRHVTAL